jgi:hypothetical protein
MPGDNFAPDILILKWSDFKGAAKPKLAVKRNAPARAKRETIFMQFSLKNGKNKEFEKP